MQDVASKIMAFSQQGPRTICVLSANGAISDVTLRQPATSGGLVTYEVLICFICMFTSPVPHVTCYQTKIMLSFLFIF
jgi:Plants and Prokaryotes Conserved (PCC) domain